MRNTNILYVFIVLALVGLVVLSYMSLLGRGAYMLSPSGLIGLSTIIIIAILTTIYLQMQNLATSIRIEMDKRISEIQRDFNDKVLTMEKIISEFRKHHLRYAKINFRNKDYINAYSNYFLAHELEETLETALHIMYCCCLDENLPDSYIFFESALRCSLNQEKNLSDFLKKAADELIRMEQLKTEIPNFNEVLCQKVKNLFAKYELPFESSKS
jgi:hypothetical protein